MFHQLKEKKEIKRDEWTGARNGATVTKRFCLPACWALS
jgi:hypothetical protein